MEETLLQIFIENRVLFPALLCRLVYVRVYNICTFAFYYAVISASLSPLSSEREREKRGRGWS
jgi:hypothetical protein